MEVFSDFHVKPSEIVLLLSGIAVLVSLPLLQSGNIFLWGFAKLLYFFGVVLFFADR